MRETEVKDAESYINYSICLCFAYSNSLREGLYVRRIFVFIERSGKFQKQKCIFVYEKNKKEIEIRQRLMELS